jgi:hypothetical protein
MVWIRNWTFFQIGIFGCDFQSLLQLGAIPTLVPNCLIGPCQLVVRVRRLRLPLDQSFRHVGGIGGSTDREPPLPEDQKIVRILGPIWALSIDLGTIPSKLDKFL